MILFISDFPNADNEKDGMVQRIAAIDEIVKDFKRVYLEISFRKYWLITSKKYSSKLSVIKINFFLYFLVIFYFAIKSKVIYVHSVYHALRILPIYFIRPVFTDMHGVVPEELLFQKQYIKAWVFEIVERIVVKNSKCIIVVTRAMAKHFRCKYLYSKSQFLHIPIFDIFKSALTKKTKANKLVVIYSGGVQKWQNVDLMIGAIKIMPCLKYFILTPYQKTFVEKLEADFSTIDITVATVPKKDVYAYYAKADFGFVLRSDELLNRVACPTKLVEYLSFGVVPIVLQPNIGDFEIMKYSYITLDDFINGNMPTSHEIENMQLNNAALIKKMSSDFEQEVNKLLTQLIKCEHC